MLALGCGVLAAADCLALLKSCTLNALSASPRWLRCRPMSSAVRTCVFQRLSCACSSSGSLRLAFLCLCFRLVLRGPVFAVVVPLPTAPRSGGCFAVILLRLIWA